MRTVDRRGKGALGIPSPLETLALAAMADGVLLTAREIGERIEAGPHGPHRVTETFATLRSLLRHDLVSYTCDAAVGHHTSINFFAITMAGRAALGRANNFYGALVDMIRWGTGGRK